jgi:hypothetical protein
LRAHQLAQGCDVHAADSRITISCSDAASAPAQEIVVSAATADIESERAGSATVHYADYRDISGTRLPYMIEVEDPRARMTIRVRRYDVNPALEEALFDIGPTP